MATRDERAKLFADLKRTGEEAKKFGYIPGRFLQDLTSSDPLELVQRYVLSKNPTDGFQRLWMEGRLNLAVENVAWLHRSLFPTAVTDAAKKRLAGAGFDVETQVGSRSKNGR